MGDEMRTNMGMREDRSRLERLDQRSLRASVSRPAKSRGDDDEWISGGQLTIIFDLVDQVIILGSATYCIYENQTILRPN